MCKFKRSDLLRQNALIYQMKIFLNAFSFEHEPHIIVVMLFNPFGATDISIDCNRFGQSLPGNTPNAGRFISAVNRNYEIIKFIWSAGILYTSQVMLRFEYFQKLRMIVA